MVNKKKPFKARRPPSGKGHFPTPQAILDFLRDNPGKLNKREIGKAFNIKGDDRQRLKILLADMEKSGQLKRQPGRKILIDGELPRITTVDLIEADEDGIFKGRALIDQESAPPKWIYFSQTQHRGKILTAGDRVLAEITKESDTKYLGRIIRVIDQEIQEIFGIFKSTPRQGGGVLFPTDRKLEASYTIHADDTKGAQDGDFIKGVFHRASRRPGSVSGKLRVLEILGHESDPKLFSLIAIESLGIPNHFPKEAVAEAQKAKLPNSREKREDLRNIPLITIDGEDARDFDDAVWATPDTNPENPGGFYMIVAIADVAYYVRPKSALDHEAYKRGNSVYFPDRVVPMLPEELSNDMCSLRPNEPRAALACHMWIDAKGNLIKSHFTRALILSHARLTYTQVQAMQDKDPSILSQIPNIPESVQSLIPVLYSAFKCMAKARLIRGTIELELPERQVSFSPEGKIARIYERSRFDSHKLIEEFMIAANVVAAQTLSKTKLPCMYRVHDAPSFEKMENLRNALKPLGLSLPKSASVSPSDLDHVLKKTKTLQQRPMIHALVLRSQSQAIYSPRNIGHFGLSLQKYAHFTSPIRRYADLLVHRALIESLGLGPGGLVEEEDTFEQFEERGIHISQTERRAMQAERETMSRYVTSFMTEHMGAQFSACISGVSRGGIFVELLETGAEGFIPMRFLPFDHYFVDESGLKLEGRQHRFCLGDPLSVELVEANARTNTLTFVPAGTPYRATRPTQNKRKSRKTGHSRKRR